MAEWKPKPWWARYPMLALTLFLVVILPICYLGAYRLGVAP